MLKRAPLLACFLRSRLVLTLLRVRGIGIGSWVAEFLNLRYDDRALVVAKPKLNKHVLVDAKQLGTYTTGL